ncbi:hypothetical protein NDU88_006824 [Pleurodeles waltl]|uniref:Uncharacterized protein n=1 Tax=Pleurodeles waltl TaxID=8319 RepID=A0AAV7VMZ1_PLEWA|nr:hypothetical protein NDU88_006824 [Pleurodeles waltl]
MGPPSQRRLSSLLDRPRGTPAPAVTSKVGRPCICGARLQAAVRRKATAWSCARPSLGPQPHGGVATRQDRRGPPQPAPPLTSCQRGRRENPSRPHSSFAAARRLQACRAASGTARHRQGPQHSTGSQGSESVNSWTGGDPVRSQRPPVRIRRN